MLDSGHSILTLALILVAGLVAGWLARKITLPGMTGQIVIGALLGPSLLGLVTAGALHELRPMTHFALGLIAVAVGNHLNFRLLRAKAGRLALLLLFEVTLTPLLVFGGMWLGGVSDWGLGAMFAAMAIATAPATVVAIIAESKARGAFVRTLIAGVALNNMACILLFEIARSAATVSRVGAGSTVDLILGPAIQLLEPLLIGVAVGAVVVVTTRRVVRSDLLASASVVAILFTAGVSDLVGVSPLLSCLFLGVALANFTPDRDEIGHRVFQDFESAIFAVFFTLAGMELDFAFLVPAGGLALLFVLARAAGKVGAARLAMGLAKAPTSTQRYLGIALIPQAGVAIGLVFVVQDDPHLADVSDLFLAVGITAVAINEIVGPITTRLAVKRSGEAGLTAPGTMDFLRPDHIVTDLASGTLAEAVGELAERLVSMHDIGVDAATLRDEALSELVGAPFAGHGLAIPHAAISQGTDIVGVMGISAAGLEDHTNDGQPVHCVVLLATPSGLGDRHLEVVAALVRAVGSDRSLEHALYHAKSPQEAFQVLHATDAADLNEILENLNAS
ncbi:MAG: cation:proton antiporter [Sandaracinaceae bacterium]|nr:cation:proton antiporter [Sandaracinaceae bacterium]